MNPFAQLITFVLLAFSTGAVGFGCLIGGWSIRSYLKGASDLRKRDVSRAACYTVLVEVFLGVWFMLLANDMTYTFNRCFLVFMVVAAFIASFAGAAASKNALK